MKGGFEVITGYCAILDYLYKFKDADRANDVSSSINIIELIDNDNSDDALQVTPNIIAVWNKNFIPQLNSSGKQIDIKERQYGATFFSDFDEFLQFVTDTLKNLEARLAQPAFEQLDMKRHKLYYLTVRSGDYNQTEV